MLGSLCSYSFDFRLASNNSMPSTGKHQEAENIVRKSLKGSLELDTVAYNTFIKAMLEAG